MGSEFQATIIRAGLVVDNVGVVGASMGARLESLMSSYTEQIGAFAYATVRTSAERPMTLV